MTKRTKCEVCNKPYSTRHLPRHMSRVHQLGMPKRRKPIERSRKTFPDGVWVQGGPKVTQKDQSKADEQHLEERRVKALQSLMTFSPSTESKSTSPIKVKVSPAVVRSPSPVKKRSVRSRTQTPYSPNPSLGSPKIQVSAFLEYVKRDKKQNAERETSRDEGSKLKLTPETLQRKSETPKATFDMLAPTCREKDAAPDRNSFGSLTLLKL